MPEDLTDRLSPCSQDSGWPARRRRSWRTAVNLDTLVWLGPRDASDIQRHFESVYRQSMQTDGDIFLHISEEEHRDYRCRRRGSRATMCEMARQWR